MNTVQRTTECVNWNSGPTMTVGEVKQRIAACIGFSYTAGTGCWYNRNGDVASEQTAGFIAGFMGLPRTAMVTHALRAGWDEARGSLAERAGMDDEDSFENQPGYAERYGQF